MLVRPVFPFFFNENVLHSSPDKYVGTSCISIFCKIMFLKVYLKILTFLAFIVLLVGMTPDCRETSKLI